MPASIAAVQARWPSARRFASLAVLSIGLIGAAASTNSAREAGCEESKGAILLTGFEPFGPNRLPNSSWEGIRRLDGKSWRGHRLICRQLPVVWDAPRRQFESLIDEYKPVAIFAFGQGDDSGFAIECLASNYRASISDNNNKQPVRPKIVEDGPDELSATADVKSLARRLTQAGFKIRLSTAAGRYLCEETLYSLEYLKERKKLATAVLFSHVPPLGANVGGERIAPDQVERYVMAMLEAWHAIQTEPAIVSTNNHGAPTAQKTPAGAEEFVRRYFRVWSNQDMQAYADCFAPNAVIQFLDDDGRVSTKPKEPFVAEQTEYHRQATVRAIEVPIAIEIHKDAKLARATVYWKLTAGQRVEYGYDHFTLQETATGWRIVNLVFYAVPPPAKPVEK